MAVFCVFPFAMQLTGIVRRRGFLAMKIRPRGEFGSRVSDFGRGLGDCPSPLILTFSPEGAKGSAIGSRGRPMIGSTRPTTGEAGLINFGFRVSEMGNSADCNLAALC